LALRYNVTLKESSAKIERAAITALRGAMNDMLNRVVKNIVPKLRVIIKDAIKNTPEYRSCNGGQLQAELGLPDITPLDDIIEQWANNISVQVKPVSIGSSGIKGGFRIGAIEQKWEDVLKNPSASISSNGKVLPWLAWLLIYGNKVIVREYSVSVQPSPKSRSGKAVMVADKKGRWRMPPQFSGTSKNNFVTRAIDAAFSDIQVMILEEVLRAVK